MQHWSQQVYQVSTGFLLPKKRAQCGPRKQKQQQKHIHRKTMQHWTQLAYPVSTGLSASKKRAQCSPHKHKQQQNRSVKQPCNTGPNRLIRFQQVYLLPKRESAQCGPRKQKQHQKRSVKEPCLMVIRGESKLNRSITRSNESQQHRSRDTDRSPRALVTQAVVTCSTLVHISSG